MSESSLDEQLKDLTPLHTSYVDHNWLNEDRTFTPFNDNNPNNVAYQLWLEQMYHRGVHPHQAMQMMRQQEMWHQHTRNAAVAAENAYVAEQINKAAQVENHDSGMTFTDDGDFVADVLNASAPMQTEISLDPLDNVEIEQNQMSDNDFDVHSLQANVNEQISFDNPYHQPLVEDVVELYGAGSTRQDLELNTPQNDMSYFDMQASTNVLDQDMQNHMAAVPPKIMSVDHAENEEVFDAYFDQPEPMDFDVEPKVEHKSIGVSSDDEFEITL